MQRTAMRIGVIQSGRLVEERVLTGSSVSVGRSGGSTVILPTEGLPARWRLFERRGDRYRMRLAPAMDGRVASGGKVLRMAEDGPRAIDLPASARGRIAVGDAVILFQIVRSPQLPRAQLPRSLRGSPARDLDRPFAALAVVSFVAHLAMVLYLRGVDWPRTPDVEEVPDVFVRQVLRRPPPPPPVAATVEPAPAVARPAPTPARPRPSIEEQKRRLVAQVGRKGLLQVLTALGENGAARDLLRNGSIDRLQEEAMREVGGLAVAQEGRALPLGGGAPGGGRIADVSALQGRTQISAANVGPGGAERRAPSVRSEPPALDEPVEGFDPRLVARAIRDHMAAVRACYERALKRHPEIGGRLVLRFALTPAGTVSSVEVDEDTLKDADVTACVKAAVASWRFPAPPRRVEVIFPFVFQPAS